MAVEKGQYNCKPIQGGGFQPHGRRQRGVHRGGGYFQVPGKDVGPVRQRLAGGPLEFWEGPLDLEPAVEAATEGGGGATSVRHVLSGGGSGSLNFWGGDLGFVGVDVPEAGGGTHGITKEDNGTYGSSSEGRDLEVCGSREGP